MTTPFDPIAALNGRSKRLGGYSYKLSPDEARYGLDAYAGDEYVVDERAMSFTLPFADGTNRDGVGDVLEVEGIDTTRHELNPICLYDHGKAVQLPIGLCESPDRKYTVQIDPQSRKAKATVYVYQGKGDFLQDGEKDYDHALFCEQLFHLWVKRLIRSGSIGYQVVQAREIPPDYVKGTPQGLHLIKTLMLECSTVVLPANKDTVRTHGKGFCPVREILCMGRVCGKSLSPMLVKSLTGMTTTTKTVSGYEGTSDTKAIRLWKITGKGPGGSNSVQIRAENEADALKQGRTLISGDRQDQLTAEVYPMGLYEFTCEWKGQQATFQSEGIDSQDARVNAQKECKKKTGLPPSSIVGQRHVGNKSLKSLRRKYRSKIVSGRKGIGNEPPAPAKPATPAKPAGRTPQQAGQAHHDATYRHATRRGHPPEVAQAHATQAKTEAESAHAQHTDPAKAEHAAAEPVAKIRATIDSTAPKSLKSLRLKYRSKALQPRDVRTLVEIIESFDRGNRIRNSASTSVSRLLMEGYLQEVPGDASALQPTERGRQLAKDKGTKAIDRNPHKQPIQVGDTVYARTQLSHSARNEAHPYGVQQDFAKQGEPLKVVRDLGNRRYRVQNKEGWEMDAGETQIRGKGIKAMGASVRVGDLKVGDRVWYDERLQVVAHLIPGGRKGSIRVVWGSGSGVNLKPDEVLKRDDGSKSMGAKGLPVGTRIALMAGPHRGKRGVITKVDRTESPPFVDLVEVKLDDGTVYGTNDASVIPASTQDRLRKLKQERSGGGGTCERGQTQAETGCDPKKRLKDLRRKYRPTKGLRRRLKSSRPGTSMMRVRHKDVDKARELAEGKGLKFHHLGTSDGVAKVKLVGDDGAMDEVAKHFGQRAVKSLNGQTKAAPKPQPGDQIKLTTTGQGKKQRWKVSIVRNGQEVHSETLEHERNAYDLRRMWTNETKASGGGQSGGTCERGQTQTNTDCTPKQKVLNRQTKGFVVYNDKGKIWDGSRWVDANSEEVDHCVFKARADAEAAAVVARNSTPVGGGAVVQQVTADGVKSMTNKRTKQMPPPPMDDMPPDEGMVEDEPVTEPFSAQIMRKLHKTKGDLLKEHEEYMPMLEHEPTKQWLQKTMGHWASHMDEIESHFDKHYKDFGLEPLEGAMDEEDLEGEDKDLTEDELEGVTDDIESEMDDTEEDKDFPDDLGEDEDMGEDEGKDADTIDDDVQAATSSGEDYPDPEDGVAGMDSKRLRRNGKNLRDRRKGACPKCGKEGCKCGKSMKSLNWKETSGQRGGQDYTAQDGKDTYHLTELSDGRFTLTVNGASGFGSGSLDEMKKRAETRQQKFGKSMQRKDLPDGTETADVPLDSVRDYDNVPPSEWEPGAGAKSLEPHETSAVGEASGFLSEIAQPDSPWDDESRMKSYHYGKTLGAIGDVGASGSLGGDMGAVPGDESVSTTEMTVDKALPDYWLDKRGQTLKTGDKVRTSSGKEGTITSKMEERGDFVIDQAYMVAPHRLEKINKHYKADPGSEEWKDEEATESEHQDVMPGTESWDEEPNEARKMCKDCSGFFDRLSQEKAFGDPHREEAGTWAKQLDGLVNAPEVEEEGPEQEEGFEEDAPTEGEGLPEPGEMRESALSSEEREAKRLGIRRKTKSRDKDDEKDDKEEAKSLKRMMASQDKQMAELNKRITGLMTGRN